MNLMQNVRNVHIETATGDMVLFCIISAKCAQPAFSTAMLL